MNGKENRIHGMVEVMPARPSAADLLRSNLIIYKALHNQLEDFGLTQNGLEHRGLSSIDQRLVTLEHELREGNSDPRVLLITKTDLLAKAVLFAAYLKGFEGEDFDEISRDIEEPTKLTDPEVEEKINLSVIVRML